MAKDRIVIPGIPTDAARVIIERLLAQEERLAILERRRGRAGVVTSDTAAKVGELLNIEAPTAGLTIVLPQSTQALRNARVTLAFRNSNPVRIVCVLGTVNGEAFVLNDRPGTYDAICDGIGGWSVQVGVSEEGSGAGGGGGGGGFTPTFDTPVDVALANAEGVSTDLARADHVHRDRIDTGSGNGFLSRRVYANAASALINTTYMGVTVQAAANWTTTADIPDGNWFHCALVASGGGGASGGQGHTSGGRGGAGGGAGAHRTWVASRAELVALLPLTMTLPLGGAGGVGTTTSTGSTGSALGQNGGQAIFGPWTVFGGGGASGSAAVGNATAGGGGGGWRSAGSGGTVSTANSTGGNPLGGSSTDRTGAETTAAGLFSVYGGGSCAVASGTQECIGGGSMHGGAAGGAPAVTNNNVGRGGHAQFGGGGGGSGGFANGAGAASAGSAGGESGQGRGAAGTAGAASTSAAVTAGDGGASPNAFLCSGGGGGGGGGANNGGTTTTTGGTGGAGGFPGGGGGGGGTAVAANATNTTAGSGGAGGDACLVVDAFA